MQGREFFNLITFKVYLIEKIVDIIRVGFAINSHTSYRLNDTKNFHGIQAHRRVSIVENYRINRQHVLEDDRDVTSFIINYEQKLFFLQEMIV